MDFWGNQISEGNILGYTDALSPYRDENGNMGYVDLDGNIVIEPRFDNAYYFCNGTAEVSENGETFYIDINGEKTNNTKYQGYNGNIDNDSICGVFTGDYLVYINNNDNGEKLMDMLIRMEMSLNLKVVNWVRFYMDMRQL